ncbi:hypothetical protein WJX81_005129 [Elliptochloris bilobata]|uniref:Uncharacterized protein n=1 Tax=Elliptochloris bilobata TaxID=381761 RepID=A0AAW1RN61_9CHLO
MAQDKQQHFFCTGGSEGIGLELARAYIARNFSVSIVSRSRKKLDAAVEELQALAKESGRTGRLFSAVADVGVCEQVLEAVRAAEAALGPIDLAVANAGVAIMGTFLDAPVSAFETTNRVNYLGVVHTLKAVLPGMVELRSGRMVIVASMAGFVGIGGFSTYAPTKFALRGLADCVRNELAGTGVALSIGFPGMTSTNMTANWGPEGRAAKEMLRVFGSHEHVSVTQAVRAMLAGLDQGAYILPNAWPRNNALVACCAGPALLSVPLALLAALLAPIMVLWNQLTVRAADRAMVKLRATQAAEAQAAVARDLASADEERRLRLLGAFTECMDTHRKGH